MTAQILTSVASWRDIETGSHPAEFHNIHFPPLQLIRIQVFELNLKHLNPLD